MYFNRFTQRAKTAIDLGVDSAKKFGHKIVGTEHLLLGLLKEKDGIASKVLNKLGVTEDILEEKGVKLVPTIEYETEELIIESVRRNMGVGYVVKNAVDYLVDEKLIDVIDLDMPLPKVEINLIYVESYLTNIANKFIKDYINKGDIWLLQ